MIAVADLALDNGKSEKLADKTAVEVREAILLRFADAYSKRQVAEQSVEQGREYMKAYVEFTYFVLGLTHLVSSGPSHKHLETATTAASLKKRSN